MSIRALKRPTKLETHQQCSASGGYVALGEAGAGHMCRGGGGIHEACSRQKVVQGGPTVQVQEKRANAIQAPVPIVVNGFIQKGKASSWCPPFGMLLRYCGRLTTYIAQDSFRARALDSGGRPGQGAQVTLSHSRQQSKQVRASNGNRRARRATRSRKFA